MAGLDSLSVIPTPTAVAFVGFLLCSIITVSLYSAIEVYSSFMKHRTNKSAVRVLYLAAFVVLGAIHGILKGLLVGSWAFGLGRLFGEVLSSPYVIISFSIITAILVERMINAPGAVTEYMTFLISRFNKMRSNL